MYKIYVQLHHICHMFGNKGPNFIMNVFFRQYKHLIYILYLPHCKQFIQDDHITYWSHTFPFNSEMQISFTLSLCRLSTTLKDFRKITEIQHRLTFNINYTKCEHCYQPKYKVASQRSYRLYLKGVHHTCCMLNFIYHFWVDSLLAYTLPFYF